MAFTNLLTAMFPVGSVYLSTTSTSPSSTIGGTWTQVKGATLAATGANSFAGGASYGGSLKISVNQIPSHNHFIYMHMPSGSNTDAQSGIEYVSGGTENTRMIGDVGGGKTICLTTGVATFGTVLPNLNSFRGGEINGIY